MTEYVKYPRTLHLPWSPGLQRDDRRMETLSALEGEEVVVTEKLDGENTTMYRDHIHARSVSSRHHPSRDWVKGLHGRIAHQIPRGWRICGENVYARHSIHYRHLASYFYLFSVWDEQDRCLAWNETVEWAELLGLEVAPELCRGPFDEDEIKGVYAPRSRRADPMEGYVVRVTRAFHRDEFQRVLGKYVRQGHIQTDKHWMHGEVVPNELAERR